MFVVAGPRYEGQLDIYLSDFDGFLEGDEGQSLGGTWMNYHFRPDLSPCISNSACSRFLICTIPSTMRLGAITGNMCYLLFRDPRDIYIWGVPWPLTIPHLNMCLRYVFDESGINLTLQAAAAAIRESFNALSRDGVPLVDHEAGECAPQPFHCSFRKLCFCASFMVQ